MTIVSTISTLLSTIHVVNPEVILLDLALARREPLDRLGLKILYMSGHTDSSIGQRGVLEAGISLLHKPFTEEETRAEDP